MVLPEKLGAMLGTALPPELTPSAVAVPRKGTLHLGLGPWCAFWSNEFIELSPNKGIAPN
jgi:hypothetical protein